MEWVAKHVRRDRLKNRNSSDFDQKQHGNRAFLQKVLFTPVHWRKFHLVPNFKVNFKYVLTTIPGRDFYKGLVRSFLIFSLYSQVGKVVRTMFLKKCFLKIKIMVIIGIKPGFLFIPILIFPLFFHLFE